MNKVIRIGLKGLLQEGIRYNASITRSLVRRVLPKWNIACGNGIGIQIGHDFAGDVAATRARCKAAIVYLSRNRNSDLKQLTKSITLLHLNFLRRHPYAVIVFHEGIGERERARIIAIAPNLVRFVEVSFTNPRWITEVAAKNWPWRMGYCHMCNFFAGAIYEHPAMALYDWYWRLDVDSYVLTPINYDLFAELDAAGYSYGYLTTFYEHETVSAGLAEWVQDVVTRMRIAPKFLNKALTMDGQWNRLAFYTNFEVARLSFWRSAQFRMFWQELQASHGIYERRWGDAPLHFIALALFEEEAKIARFTDIGYRHVNFFACP